MIICKECGGKFEEKEAACPYCGALNYVGAEEQYMNNLESLRSDMSAMEDDSQEAYASSAKKSSIIIIATLSTLLLIAGIIVAIVLIVHSVISATEDEDIVQKQMLWRQEYFDDLDAMYAAGEYDQIMTFMDEHAEDEGYSLYSWEHGDFMQVYKTYSMFQDDLANWDSTDLVMKKWTLYDATSIDYYLQSDAYMFTEEDKALMENWSQETRAFYQDKLGLTDAEIEEMHQVVSSDNELGLPSSKMCEKYLVEYLGY